MLVILDQNHHIIMSIWTLKRHCHGSGLFRGKNHIDLDLLHGIACLTVLWHDKVGPTLRSDVFFFLEIYDFSFRKYSAFCLVNVQLFLGNHDMNGKLNPSIDLAFLSFLFYLTAVLV